MKDVEHIAAALFDGGWRSTDKEELQQEHGLTDEETAKIAAELEKIEARNQ